MSEPLPTEPPAKKTRISVLGCGCLTLFFAFLLLMGGAIGLFQIVFYLLFGWAAFIAETFPRIRWDAGAILFGLLCLAGIVAIAQNFLSWVYRSAMNAKGNPNATWSWKWTFTGLACIALLFLIGMSVTGIAHQAAWLSETEGEMFEQRPRGMETYHHMRAAEMIVREALLDTNTIAGLRGELKRRVTGSQPTNTEKKGLESCKLLALSSDGVHIDGVLVVPRKTNVFTYGIPFVTEKDSTNMTRVDVPEFLKTNEFRLIQLGVP